jgi:putative solute:sodium symporter small subunit
MADKPSPSDNRRAYWRANLRIVAYLMTVWFIVSFGCGILFVEQLNKIQIGGYKLGFWMAQQGSIYVFVALIFIYVRLMNKLDDKHGFSEQPDPSTETKPEEDA